jgi:hypothetical protein
MAVFLRVDPRARQPDLERLEVARDMDETFKGVDLEEVTRNEKLQVQSDQFLERRRDEVPLSCLSL